MTHLMMRVALACSLTLGACLPASAAEPDKPVRFAWFPDFSPDGKLLVVPYGGWLGNEAGEVRVWDVSNGKAKFVIASPRGVRAVAWSPKGSFFASGNYGGEMRLYDAKTGKSMREITVPSSVEILQITPDERQAITASRDGNVRIWDVSTGKLIRTIKAHAGDIWGMRLAPDGKTLATAGKDRTVGVWSIESGKRLYQLQHPSVTNGVAFDSKSRVLATGCWDGGIRLWDLTTGEMTHTFMGHNGGVNDLDFSSQDDLLVSSSSDRTVRIWDVKTGKSRDPLEGHQREVFGSRFSPKDDNVIASASWDGTVKLWNAASGELMMTLER